MSAYNKLYPLAKSVLILLLFFLVFGGLYLGRTFFIPLAYAAILAMLMAPLCQKIENQGISRAAATLICILIMLLFFSGLAAVLSAQIAGFVQDLPELEEQLKEHFSTAKQFMQENFSVTPQEAVQGESSSGVGSTIFRFLGSFTSILASSLLTLVYLFMLINYRSHFSSFILKAVPADKKEKTKRIVKDSSSVAQQYLLGRAMLITILGVMYSIGLLIVGVEHAILLSVLAALISIIPYIGNIIGISFPLLMGVVQGDGLGIFIGIIVVFAIAQFVESYILEPYVVGAEVNIHPFFTIAIIIAGEIIWGISGMILAIPILGILKVTMENIEPLKPYAFLIGNSKGNDNPSGIMEKIKRWGN